MSASYRPLPIEAGQHVVIAGAGLVGSLLGIELAEAGFKVTLLDKRPQPGTEKYLQQLGLRSINLALSHRGWKALRAIGAEEEIRKIAVPMTGRVVHDLEGKAQHFAYGTEGQAIYSVSRGKLNQFLNEKAQSYPNLEIRYDTRARGVDFDTMTVFADGPTGAEQFPADVAIACDGAYSALRQSFQFSDRFDFSQNYIDSGYQEYHMESAPSNEGGGWPMRHDGLHIWPRKNFMMIGLPNPDGTFTCTLFLAFEGSEDSFAALKSPAYARKFFAYNFPDLLKLIPDYEEQARENPISSLVTIRCQPWNRNRALLIGDAAHGIVPFYGQGMNAGFEDVDILIAMMKDGQDSTWEGLLARFAQHRKPSTDAIADLALANFTEMRARVADPEFQWFKKIDAALARLFPEDWIPLYTMVSFTSTPYEEAQRRGARQENIGYQIMRLPNARRNWENDDWLQEAYARVAEGD